MYRLSKGSLALSKTCFDLQSAWASTKSIPCFRLLLSLFRGSNSNSTSYFVADFPDGRELFPWGVATASQLRSYNILISFLG